MPTKKENSQHPNVKARVLPHNDEAEQAVLGCVLINAEDRDLEENARSAILNELKASDFYRSGHQDIYTAMSNLYQKNQPIDFVTLLQEIDEMGSMEKVGGITYITSLTTAIPSAGNYMHYMEIVKKTSLLRQLIASSQKVMDCAFSGDAEDDALALAEREIYALAEKEDRSSVVDMRTALEKAIKIMDEKQMNPTEQNTVPIPFEKLNDMLGGFHPSDLVLIAARPAQGKTSLGMNFISHAALDKSRRTLAGKLDPFKCAVFSLEMSAEQLATRLICSVAKVNMQSVKQGRRNVAENNRLVEAEKKLQDAQIFIDDNAMTTPIEILSKCRRLKREHGLDLVLVDYLQLMSSGKRVESRQQEVADITRTMKIAAKELNVPILLLSQMSRDIEKRQDKKPQMSDLRESGAIEQDADIIIFLHREVDPNDMSADEDKRTKCDLIVAKHRNGSTGTVTVRWHGEYTTFEDLNAASKSSVDERKETTFKNNFIISDDTPIENAPPAYDAPPSVEEQSQDIAGFVDAFEMPVTVTPKKKKTSDDDEGDVL